ncbi:Rv1733c family protein [Streptacidiphilus neutrinimicus]|uniref:Rv1733c family protein n=1 Tax=Streptacidiphilus neutrinimicus TaxID=105420 RepID=UPI001377F839|nr:hypothetical protein [Streptacidiphilus neutrinimicus]
MAAPAADPRPSAGAPSRSLLAMARARRHSVLRRPSDRWRSALLEVQALALVAVTVLCALLGLSLFQQGRTHAQQVERGLRPVQARVVGQPYPAGVGGDMAQVSWTAADGTTHQGSVEVAASERVGGHVRIWLDPAGNLSTGPATTANLVSTAALSALLVMVGADAVLLGAGAIARSRLDRRDQEAWEKEWRVYEPRWSRP